MLDVDGRVDVDSGLEDVVDVLVALRVLEARRVGVGKLVDQSQLRRPSKIAGRSISSSSESRYATRRRGSASNPSA